MKVVEFNVGNELFQYVFMKSARPRMLTEVGFGRKNTYMMLFDTMKKVFVSNNDSKN